MGNPDPAPDRVDPPSRSPILLMGTATLCIGGLWNHGIVSWGETK